MNAITKRALTLLAVAAAFWPALGFSQGKPPVKIGAVFSMSGPAAVFGIPERDSLNSLIKEYGGMMDGRKVDFVFCDDKTNPTEAARWFLRAAKNGNVPGEVEYAILLFNGEGVKRDEALAFYERARTSGAPAGVDLHLTLADLYRQTGKPAEAEMRGEAVTSKVSVVARMPAVREWVNSLVRKAGQKFDVVVDGRDIGTVVFPNADLKFFLTATPEARARRRFIEDQSKGRISTILSLLRRDCCCNRCRAERTCKE